jgi:uncharacterized protein YjbI with pentapeptide repeats
VGQKKLVRKAEPPSKRGIAWPRWTGFRGKTVWDFLQLLIVPLMLVAIGLVFSLQQDARQQRVEDQRAQAERELAEQRAQDEALQAYLDQMSQLMLERKLLDAEPGDPVHTLAQARTSTVILRLDAEHNESVTRFLINSGLAVSGEASARLLRKITLSDATLSHTFLPNADLSDVNLSGADLANADLSHTFLPNTDLSDANLSGADLANAVVGDPDLSGANLSGANLASVFLLDANLSRADLGGAHLPNASLENANLRGHDLSDTYLFNANLIEADLREADLSGADLEKADGITNEELEQQAASLEGATMPNGQKYEDWLKDKEG